MNDENQSRGADEAENDLRLYDGEYKLMSAVWENEPLPSRKLVDICERAYGWKKSTTYTVLRKLCERGFVKNENTTVVSLVGKHEIAAVESRRVVDRFFGGSLSNLVAAFADTELTPEEIAELRSLIDKKTAENMKGES